MLFSGLKVTVWTCASMNRASNVCFNRDVCTFAWGTADAMRERSAVPSLARGSKRGVSSGSDSGAILIDGMVAKYPTSRVPYELAATK